MRVVASPEALQLIHDRGGRLFVRAARKRCCGGAITFLKSSAEPDGHAFRRVTDGEIELYLDERLPGLPEELHFEARGWRKKRVEAYWNGCAYVA